MKLSLSAACLLGVSFLAAYGGDQAEKPDSYGSWMTRPQAEWPQLALVNQIDYEEKHHPVAGCGFLLEFEAETVAATAKHVLTYFKSSEMDSVDFKGTLKSWKMFPKDHPAYVVVVDELINQDADESITDIPCGKDWLLFTVKKRSKKIQPLRLRTTPLEEGEPIYLIGWRYTEKDCPQVVYDGKFVRMEKDSVCITVPKLIENTIPGLSGAPVIDGKGYVIGIMSRGKGEIQRAWPIAYPRRLLKERTEGK